MHCQCKPNHFEDITHLIEPLWSHMFQESRLSFWGYSILNCLPFCSHVLKLQFVDLDADINLVFFCSMSEHDVEGVHFTNTITVAIAVKINTLFFEALIFKTWFSKKFAFEVWFCFVFLVKIVVFILYCREFMIKEPRRTDKSSIFRMFLTRI